MPPLQQVVMFFSVVGPVVGLIVAIVLLWHSNGGPTRRMYSIGWPEIIAMLIAYLLTGFAVTTGFHRLLTHRSFETYRPIKLMLAILGSASGQGMCIRGARRIAGITRTPTRRATRIPPHVHDHGEGPLAMLRGLWHAHVAWCFDADKPNLARSVPDLLADRALVRIDALYFFWVAVGILLPAVALIALLVGWPSFRLSGHYYAIATVVVAEIGYLLFLNWDFVGGASGIFIPFHGQSWIDLQFRTTKLPFHYLALAFAAAAWLAAWWLEGSRWGYAWRAVRDDVIAARSLSVRVLPAKLVAAGVSGFFTGAGGAIYAQYVGYIDPDSVMVTNLSILIALPAVLGGVGTLWGPLIGAAVLIPTSEVTRSYLGGAGGVDLMIYGGLIVAVALLRPAGLVSLLGLRKPAEAPSAAP